MLYDAARATGTAAAQHLTGNFENKLEGPNNKIGQGTGFTQISDQSDLMQGQLGMSKDTVQSARSVGFTARESMSG